MFPHPQSATGLSRAWGGSVGKAGGLRKCWAGPTKTDAALLQAVGSIDPNGLHEE